MVWATISADGKSQIIQFNGSVTARRYQDETLAVGLLPFPNQHNNQMQFMQDNASPHRVHATRDWLQNHSIDVFGPWPSKSPDMNPIEKLWAQMENAIRKMQLWQAVREEWASLLFAAWCSPCADAAAPLWGRLAAIPNIESAFAIFLMIEVIFKILNNSFGQGCNQFFYSVSKEGFSPNHLRNKLLQ